MWAIYDRPKDYPAHFVARRWEILPSALRGTEDFRFADTLEAVRTMLPGGLAMLARQPGDDPCIVEVWL